MNIQKLSVAIQNPRYPIQLILLNACHSAYFSSDLIRMGIPAVVATQFPVSNQACEAFSRTFYQGLIRSGNVESAVVQGRKELFCDGSVEWASFSLYLQAKSGKLFAPLEEGGGAPPGPECNLELDWVRIPGGTFHAGSDKAAIESILRKFNRLDAHNLEVLCDPPHDVDVPEFWITKTPITNSQFMAFVNATNRNAPKHWPFPESASERPVVNASREDADAFARWLNKDLPTIAQWEKAARGTTDLRCFPWGNDFDPSFASCAEGRGELVDVTYYAKGKSPFGVIDMVGNAAEFVREKNEAGFVASKGGSFEATCEIYGLIHFTCWVQDGHGAGNRGFRVVSSVDPNR